MKTPPTDVARFQKVLQRIQSELRLALERRDGITIEKSADQMDEIQYASERDLAIRNMDRESILARQVKAALERIHEGGFGICTDCDSAITPRRLAALPWAPRCIRCQEVADRSEKERTNVSELLGSAA